MANFIWVIFNCYCVDLLALYNLCIHPHWDLKGTIYMNLQFESADKDETWCETLGQFIDLHFPDLNPNYFDLNNMKFDLDVSTKVKFKWPGS